MSTPLYRLQGVTAGYGAAPALTVEELTVSRSCILGLYGHNGSGKSTLLRLLGFLLEPTSGRVEFEGREVDAAMRRNGHLLRRQAVLLGQDTCLLKRSVAANVAYGLELRGRSVPEGAIEAALERVGLRPEIYARRPWRQLSGGEARRVALAARLVLSPKVLLLDEPTAGLDRSSTEHVMRAVLSARQEQGTALVISSHDLAWLQASADTVLTLEEGRITGCL